MTWGPDARRGAVSLTFDNWGEAAAALRGEHVPPGMQGRHPTVTHMLPELLGMLGDLPATWFIEACNTLVYPEEISRWSEAGKDIGIHAWQHESWGKLDALERQANLHRSVDAFSDLGLSPRGFRPPGGAPGELQEYVDAGLSYCSPLGAEGSSAMVKAGDKSLAVLPFAWQHVDAYMIDPKLGALRERTGGRHEAATMDEWWAVLDAALESAATEGVHIPLIFHPVTLIEHPQSVPVLRRFMRQLESARGDLWVADCASVAAWLTAP